MARSQSSDNEKSVVDTNGGQSQAPSEDGELNKGVPQDHEIKSQNPPLPQGTAPPLPDEEPPAQDDGWDAVWDENAQAFYFYNRFTQKSQWTNPRVPEDAGPPGVGNYDRIGDEPPPNGEPQEEAGKTEYTGYNPAIHGDYDPTASYARAPPEAVSDPTDPSNQNGSDAKDLYAATGAFNRFTGKWQAADINPENHNDENKSKRQMSAFFDVDAAANSHHGRSLKAERSGKKLSRQELKAFKDKRKEKKEEKRRAWLRD